MIDQDTAKQIVETLLHDLTGRKGLRHVWDEIDEEIQDEIKEEWVKLVLAHN